MDGRQGIRSSGLEISRGISVERYILPIDVTRPYMKSSTRYLLHGIN